MRYISKLTGIGIGSTTIPNRKNKSLVYIDGNSETVIGTVKDEKLFEKAIEEILYYEFEDRMASDGFDKQTGCASRTEKDLGRVSDER